MLLCLELFMLLAAFKSSLAAGEIRSTDYATGICFANRWDHDVRRNRFPDKSDCHSFVECFTTVVEQSPNLVVSKVGLLRRCENGKFYDASLMRCIPEGSDSCSPVVIDEVEFCLNKWDGRPASYLFAHEANCHSFIQCMGDGSRAGVLHHCEKRSYWNAGESRCAKEGSVPCEPAITDASLFCQRNWKSNSPTNNVFADESDCYSFIECFEVVEDFDKSRRIIGYFRSCDEGFFWHARKQKCVEEEQGLQCKERQVCTDPQSIALGKYPGPSCSQFYFCNSTAVGCCGQSQRFNPETGSCQPDHTCQDDCRDLVDDSPATATQPTACQDERGNTLIGYDRSPTYRQGSRIFRCEVGFFFSSDDCKCRFISAIDELINRQLL